MRKITRRVKNFAIATGIAIGSLFPNKLAEGKTYDAELTQSVAQILDARYTNDTTEVGKAWRIISAKENITANDVYNFLINYWDAIMYVEDICPTCVLGLAEIIRRQNLENQGRNEGGNGGVDIKPSGQSEQEKPKPEGKGISQEAKNFFSKKIEVGEKKMSALEYLIACGYTDEEIEAIYRKIKKDWENETPNLSMEFLDAYALEVTGRVLKPTEPNNELTQAQIDSLRSWALDTLQATFENSLGAAKKLWDNYYKWGDKSLDGIYKFCLDVRSLCDNRQGEVVQMVIDKIGLYTEERKETQEKMRKGTNGH
ncbi:MAG: hypothetical protein QXG02_01455 [Candidatus Anstonellales archaeon]